MSSPRCIWDAKSVLGEGVIWHDIDKSIYWVDIAKSYLHRIDINGRKASWFFSGSCSALAPCNEGGFLACYENGLAHIDLDKEILTPLLDLESDMNGNRFNDGCVDKLGRFWFGSMDKFERENSGRFYYLDLDGSVITLDALGKMIITNGPAFSCDGRWAFFTDTIEKKIYRAILDDTGIIGDPELHIDFKGYEGYPDGMCTDTCGGLWVCHFGGGQVTRFFPDGSLDQKIELPVPNVTKCAFGGLGLSTLYITTASKGLDSLGRKEFPLSGGLFSVEVSFKGDSIQLVEYPTIS